MVGTDELRHLLDATTAARAKTVLVGDPYQLAPVKARGGMFEQLCDRVCPGRNAFPQVWRMRDPDERDASLALRDGARQPATQSGRLVSQPAPAAHR